MKGSWRDSAKGRGERGEGGQKQLSLGRPTQLEEITNAFIKREILSI